MVFRVFNKGPGWKILLWWKAPGSWRPDSSDASQWLDDPFWDRGDDDRYGRGGGYGGKETSSASSDRTKFNCGLHACPLSWRTMTIMAAPAPKLSASVSMRFAKSLSAPLEQGGDRRGDPELGPRNARKARLAVPYLWGTPRPRNRDRRRPTAGSVSQVHQGGEGDCR